MPELPTGTVTFLFTDVEGSTRLVQELGDRFSGVLAIHHDILRRAIAAHHGTEVSTEGDAFFAVFPTAIDAVEATVQAQRDLAGTDWPDGAEIRVRMGLHTGNAELGGDNYVGVDVNRAARISAAGHGGQVLLSDATRALAEPSLPGAVTLRDLGRHRLKDLRAPEHLQQLVITGLPAEFPALKTLDASPTNLVEPATALIGREREVGEILTLLEANRLLTLTGPGGTGKTRLAHEVGVRARGDFADGVFFVPLETFTERPPVASAMAQALSLRVAGAQDPEEVLLEQLASRHLLLILDNFEQVTVAAPLVARLLAAAAALRVIATSRIPLHVSGEQEFPVPPLAVPDTGRGAGVDEARQFEAVNLFVERARRVQPAFELTDRNVGAVVAISQRLDGLPLAIELAAARMKLFPPDAILARLEQALPMLGGGSVDLPARQQTLRGAIEWSYRLLDPPGQGLFCRLSVFAGGWTVDAAEQVVAANGEQPDLLDGLAALVDQSLARPSARAEDGEPRFEMLQLIREYGAERLAASGDEPAMRRRHAAWALAMAEEAAPVLERGMDDGGLDRLAHEHDNLRAALRWLIDSGEREQGLRLASAIWRFWQLRGHVHEGRMWFGQLMPADPRDESLDPVVLAAAHTAAGGLAYWANAVDDAEGNYQAAIEIDRANGLQDRLGDDTYNLAFVPLVRGDLDLARPRLLEAADLFAAAGQTGRLADTTAARGAVEMRARNLVEARALMEEGRRLNLQAGNLRRATDNGMVLTNIHLGLREAEAARNCLLTSIRETQELGDLSRWPAILELGAAVLQAAGRSTDALRMGGASERRRADLGGGPPSFIVSDFAGIVADARAAVDGQEGPGAADRAWADGAELDEEALVEVLSRDVLRRGNL